MSFDLLSWIALATAVGVGAFVQAAVGFGFGIVATPVALGVIGSVEAIAVMVGVHLVQAVLVVPRVARDAPRRLLLTLMAASLIGMPAGLIVLGQLDLPTLRLVVGVSLLAFTAYLTWREFASRSAPTVARDAAIGAGGQSPALTTVAASAGAIAGGLTALLVMPGPPVAILGGWLRMSPQTFRALMLTFMSFCYVATAALFAVVGRATHDVMLTTAILAPVVAVATLAGGALSGRLGDQRHRAAILLICALSGIYALASAL
ncbi:MAG: sulfite exporter TauE/SafE family protein [Pseudomonadota bacterium]